MEKRVFIFLIIFAGFLLAGAFFYESEDLTGNVIFSRNITNILKPGLFEKRIDPAIFKADMTNYTQKYCAEAKQKLQQYGGAAACINSNKDLASSGIDPYKANKVYVYYNFSCPECINHKTISGCYEIADECKDKGVTKSVFMTKFQCKQEYLSQEVFKEEFDYSFFNLYPGKSKTSAWTTVLQKSADYAAKTLFVQKTPMKCNPYNNEYCLYGSCVKKIIDSDLYVKDFKLKSEKCVNQFYMTICNKGKDAVKTPFEMNIEINNIGHKLNYNPETHGVLNADSCIDYYDNKLNIFGFSLQLGKTVTAKIDLDTQNNIAETDENNKFNFNSYTGDKFIYEGDKECNTWCYDTDNGPEIEQWTKKGSTYFKYNDLFWSQEDNCNKNGILLIEHTCINIYLLDNGEFSNPLKTSGWIDCRLAGKMLGGNSGRCVDGKCVVSNLSDGFCYDYENGQNDGEKGRLQYSDSDQLNVTELWDVCQEDNVLLERYCGSGTYLNQGFFEENYIYCEHFGKICANGACVKPDDMEVTCSDTDGGLNYGVPGITSTKMSYTFGGIKYNKDAITITDYCDEYGTILTERYCDDGMLDSKQYSCFDNNQGCVMINVPYKDDSYISSGKCADKNPDLEECSSTSEGIDYFSRGETNVTNQFGINVLSVDHCISDTQVIDYYCDGKEGKMTDPFTCPEGYGCHGDKCSKKVDPSQVYCVEKGNPDSLNTQTMVFGVNNFGEEYTGTNYCNDEDHISTVYCDGKNNAVNQNIPCPSGTKCTGDQLDNYWVSYCK